MALPKFIAQLEDVKVEPDRRAKVVVNERTGTVVAGADVRLSRVAIAHGDLKISILTDNTVSKVDRVMPVEAVDHRLRKPGLCVRHPILPLWF